jgi:hypothetical protein
MNDLLIFHLVRKYWWLYLAAVSAGLLWVLISVPEKPTYWQWKGHIYCKAEFYDPMISITNSWNKSTGDSAASGMPLSVEDMLRTDSYRNEDIYVFEIQADLQDSSRLKELTLWMNEQVNADTLIRSRFHDKREGMLKALQYAESINPDSLKNPLEPLQLINYIVSLRNQINELNVRFTISFPSSESMVKITPDRNRQFIMAISFSLLISLACSLLIDRRKKPGTINRA